ncbi:ubiquitin carboxyl-terminal hydrolase [Chrysoperla carnea]|uniref:ubiquitin carboxyl-terminal hydrolase n=1 Tax=Chrysoperla carnea TaxID=189513 RepID=UPI001D05F250|nr:ubiquitin carboxyl-terminal hydrolase [Chrysoperla carnea]
MAATWLPLESNPDVMNKYLQNLGVSEKWNIVDVFGLEEEALQWIPRPTLGLILLYPVNEQSEQRHAEEKTDEQKISPKVLYLKQYVHNACGTIALIHSIANNRDKIEIGDGPLKKFLDEADGLDASKRGELLQNAEGIIQSHAEIALEGQTAAPEPSTPINFHFVAFVHVDGDLYELDGRRSGPVNHGPTTPEKFVEDAAKVCKQYIERDPNDVHFTVVALAAKD